MNWKPVTGYEGFYEVSECGKIRRVHGGRGAQIGRLISTKRTNSKGYEVAELCVGDTKKRIFVHRIVCAAFHGEQPTGTCVNHKDGQKRNNHASNLEWATPAENNRHAQVMGLHKPLKGEANGRAKLTQELADQIRDLKGVLGARAIAVRFRVSRSTVQQIHQGLKWPTDIRVRQYPEVRR